MWVDLERCHTECRNQKEKQIHIHIYVETRKNGIEGLICEQK